MTIFMRPKKKDFVAIPSICFRGPWLHTLAQCFLKLILVAWSIWWKKPVALKGKFPCRRVASMAKLSILSTPYIYINFTNTLKLGAEDCLG